MYLNLGVMSESFANSKAASGGGGAVFDIGVVNGTTQTTEGTLVSPSYPSNHPTGELSWSVTFQAPVGQNVRITLQEYDTDNTWYQRGLEPITPFVGPIVNKIYGSYPNTTGTFSNPANVLPWQIGGTDNEMIIEFDTWGTTTGTWKLLVEFV